MTKEVDLFLGETKSVETTKTKSSQKKEGGSLFDSMLTTAKKDTTETKNSKTTTNTPEKTTTVEVKEKPKAQIKNEQISENKITIVTDENQSIKDNKNAPSSKETDESTKNENPAKKQSGSLLDKLVVEAKGTLEKGTNTKETKQDVKNNETISSDEPKKEIDKELKDTKNSTKKTEADLEVETNKSQKNSNEEKVEVQDNKKETKNLDEKLTNLKENNSKQIVDDNKDNSDKNLTADKKEETSKAELKGDKVVIDNDAKTEVQKNSAENRVVIDNTVDNSNEKILKEVKNADTKVEKTVSDKVVSNLKEEVKNENPSKASIEKNVQPNESKVETDVTKIKSQENVKSDDSTIKNNKIETAVKEPVVEKTILNQSEATNVKNEKVAQELAKLNTSETVEEKVNIKQDNLASSNDKKSLLDKLVDESKKEMATSQKTEANSDLKVLQEQTKDTKSGLLTSMYLSSQKKSIDDKSLEVKHEGKKRTNKMNKGDRKKK